MNVRRTTVTYLQMFRWHGDQSVPPCEGVSVERLDQPTVRQYQELYDGVGQDYGWTDRHRMDKEALRRQIQDPCVEIHCLRVALDLAGYAELDRRHSADIQIVYFGLFPNFIGRGLGKYFLSWTLQRAWSFNPSRVWLHTCDLDHPAALPNYLRAGFHVYRTEVVDG